MFYTQMLRVLAVALGLAVFVGGCVVMVPTKQRKPVASAEIFKDVLPVTRGLLENESYASAYRAILMEQNRRKPANLEEVAKVAEIRSQVAKIALRKALVSLRRHYYQGSVDLAKMSADDANFICEMETLVKPDFLVALSLRLQQHQQEPREYRRELYLIYVDESWQGVRS